MPLWLQIKRSFADWDDCIPWIPLIEQTNSAIALGKCWIGVFVGFWKLLSAAFCSDRSSAAKSFGERHQLNCCEMMVVLIYLCWSLRLCLQSSAIKQIFSRGAAWAQGPRSPASRQQLIAASNKRDCNVNNQSWWEIQGYIGRVLPLGQKLSWNYPKLLRMTSEKSSNGAYILSMQLETDVFLHRSVAECAGSWQDLSCLSYA